MATTWDAIVIAGTRAAGAPPLGDWQLARALATTHRVLYAEPPVPLHRLREIRPVGLLEPAVHGIDFHVFRGVTSPGYNRPGASAVANRLWYEQLSRAAARVLDASAVVITFDPKRGVPRGLTPRLGIYWLRDRLVLSRNTRHPELVKRYHRDLLAWADLVTAVSEPLAAEARPDAQQVAVVANGCDFPHFATTTRRPSRTGRVRIGYVGGLSWRVDMNLVAAVARRRMNWQFTLIGHADGKIPNPGLPNVELLPPIGYDAVPHALGAFDVAIIPYRRDAFNLASSPLKAFEYLASGLPVVATTLPALTGFHPYIRVADDADGFIAAIEDALERGPDIDSCRAVARTHDWTARAHQLEDLVTACLKTRSAGRPAQRHEPLGAPGVCP